MIKQIGLLLTIGSMVLCGCPSSPPIEYQYTYFPPDGYSSLFAKDINNNGEVVGTDIRYGPFYAFLDSDALIYNGSDYTFILPEGWRFSSASAINDSGEVVGWGEDANGAKKGFIYSGGVYFELLQEGSSLTIAFDINNNGEVVGWGVDGAGVDKGFIYSGGQYTELLPPHWAKAYALGINNNGKVIGEGEDATAITKGFIYKDGQYTELLPPNWHIPWPRRCTPRNPASAARSASWKTSWDRDLRARRQAPDRIDAPGETVLPIIERLLQEADNLKRAGEDFASPDRGALTIAATHSQARYALPPAVRDFSASTRRCPCACTRARPSRWPRCCWPAKPTSAWPPRRWRLPRSGRAAHATSGRTVSSCRRATPWPHDADAGAPLTLARLAQFPIITYEPGYTGRSHIDDAFERQRPELQSRALGDGRRRDQDLRGARHGRGHHRRHGLRRARDTHLRAIDAGHLFASNMTRLAFGAAASCAATSTTSSSPSRRR